MTDFPWLIPLFPLVAFAINGAFGPRYLKKATGIHRLGGHPGRFRGNGRALDRGSPLRYSRLHALPLGLLRFVQHRHRVRSRSPYGSDAAGSDGRELPGTRLLHRLHGPRRVVRQVLHLAAALRVRDDHAGAIQQLPIALRVLGAGRSLLISAHRLLAPAQVRS